MDCPKVGASEPFTICYGLGKAIGIDAACVEGGNLPSRASAEPLTVCEVLTGQKGVIQQQIGNINILVAVSAHAALHMVEVCLWLPQRTRATLAYA